MEEKKKEQNKPIITGGKLISVNKTLMSQVESLANIEAAPLTSEEKTFAVEIITGLQKRLTEENYDITNVDVTGSGLSQQIKRYARLRLSLHEHEIYLNIRKNGKTEMLDVSIEPQYQAKERIMARWCHVGGGITRPFLKGIVLEGEMFSTKTNFATGDITITDHEYDEGRHLTYKDSWEKVRKAYCVAYHADGTSTTVIIDRDRIMRAYDASPTKEKPIWKSDMAKMVIKTAVIEMYNKLKPFIEIPIELQSDYHAMNDVDEMNWEPEQTIKKEQQMELANLIGNDKSKYEIMVKAGYKHLKEIPVSRFEEIKKLINGEIIEPDYETITEETPAQPTTTKPTQPTQDIPTEQDEGGQQKLV